MIKTCTVCDVCGKKLPIETFMVNGNVRETIKIARTKEWDTHLIFPYLCEKCALELDNAFLKFKLEVLLGDRA